MHLNQPKPIVDPGLILGSTSYEFRQMCASIWVSLVGNHPGGKESACSAGEHRGIFRAVKIKIWDYQTTLPAS